MIAWSRSMPVDGLTVQGEEHVVTGTISGTGRTDREYWRGGPAPRGDRGERGGCGQHFNIHRVASRGAPPLSYGAGYRAAEARAHAGGEGSYRDGLGATPA